jgi:phage-related protein
MKREIEFYESENGKIPVQLFLDSLNEREFKKVFWVLRLITEFAIIPANYFKKLPNTDDIWEVIIDSGSDTYRILGFLYKNNIILLTNGFQKKTQKTPKNEIELAEKLKKDYLRRKNI